jgi:hypothetical protein
MATRIPPASAAALAEPAADTAPLQVHSESEAKLFPLTSVRLLDGPFAQGVAANRAYMLALDPDRLLAPFLREAGLAPRKPAYDNWESGGLDGHTPLLPWEGLIVVVRSHSGEAQHFVPAPHHAELCLLLQNHRACR